MLLYVDETAATQSHSVLQPAAVHCQDFFFFLRANSHSAHYLLFAYVHFLFVYV